MIIFSLENKYFGHVKERIFDYFDDIDHVGL